jgi:hypothetical protein
MDQKYFVMFITIILLLSESTNTNPSFYDSHRIEPNHNEATQLKTTL